jgi:hypothetical protein
MPAIVTSPSGITLIDVPIAPAAIALVMNTFTKRAFLSGVLPVAFFTRSEYLHYIKLIIDQDRQFLTRDPCVLAWPYVTIIGLGIRDTILQILQVS